MLASTLVTLLVIEWVFRLAGIDGHYPAARVDRFIPADCLGQECPDGAAPVVECHTAGLRPITPRRACSVRVRAYRDSLHSSRLPVLKGEPDTWLLHHVGDGIDDVLVGAFQEDSRGSNAGATHLILGGGGSASCLLYAVGRDDDNDLVIFI